MAVAVAVVAARVSVCLPVGEQQEMDGWTDGWWEPEKFWARGRRWMGSAMRQNSESRQDVLLLTGNETCSSENSGRDRRVWWMRPLSNYSQVRPVERVAMISASALSDGDGDVRPSIIRTRRLPALSSGRASQPTARPTPIGFFLLLLIDWSRIVWSRIVAAPPPLANVLFAYRLQLASWSLLVP